MWPKWTLSSRRPTMCEKCGRFVVKRGRAGGVEELLREGNRMRTWKNTYWRTEMPMKLLGVTNARPCLPACGWDRSTFASPFCQGALWNTTTVTLITSASPSSTSMSKCPDCPEPLAVKDSSADESGRDVVVCRHCCPSYEVPVHGGLLQGVQGSSDCPPTGTLGGGVAGGGPFSELGPKFMSCGMSRKPRCRQGLGACKLAGIFIPNVTGLHQTLLTALEAQRSAMAKGR